MTLVAAVSVLIPVCLFAGSIALLAKARTLCTILQVLGSGLFLASVLIEVLTHFGVEKDRLSVAGLAIFAVAFLIRALSKK